jgi:hypothetical protein
VADDPRLTHTGWLLGTPGYLAPEILYGDDATTASDVHSLAATIVLAGAGHPPFGRGPAVAVMDRVRRGEHVLDGLPDRMHGLVLACLNPDPARRPTLDEVRAALRLPDSPLTTAVRPLEPPEEDVFTAPLALAALAGTAERTEVEPRREDEDRGDRWAEDPWADDREGSWDTPDDWPVVPVRRPEPGWQTAAYSHGAAGQPSPPWAPGHPPLAPRLPAAHRARRTALFLGLAAAVGALIAAVPYVMGALAVLGAWLLRSGSQAGSAVRYRREVRGGRHWSDGPRLLLGAPFHLVRSVPATVLLVVWGVGIATATWLLTYALSLDLGQTMLACGVAFALALGLGPGGGRVRGPLSRVVTPLAADRNRWAVGCLVVGAVAVCAAYVALTSGPDWSPATDQPFADLSLTSLLR